MQPHLFQGEGVPVLQAEAHAQDLLLALRKRAQNLLELLLQQPERAGGGGVLHVLVLDEVAEDRILFLSDRRLQRDGLARDPLDRLDARRGPMQALGHLLVAGLTTQFLHQLPRLAHHLVDLLDHVHGHADGPRLIGDRAGDRLPDPPRGVRGELVTLAVLELLHRLDQADVALLHQVEEMQPAVGVLLGDAYHQPQVGLDQTILGPLHHHPPVLDLPGHGQNLVTGLLEVVFQTGQLALIDLKDADQLLDLLRRQVQLVLDACLLGLLGKPPAQVAQLLGVRYPQLVLNAALVLGDRVDLAGGAGEEVGDFVDFVLVEGDVLEGAQNGRPQRAQMVVAEHRAPLLHDLLLGVHVALEGGVQLADRVLVPGVQPPAVGEELRRLLLGEVELPRILGGAGALGDAVELRNQGAAGSEHVLDDILAGLHLLRQANLVLRRKQVLPADLAQVQAYRIVDR